MISIVISIRPEWACKILNGEKKIEVRKGLALYNALKKAEERGEEVQFLMYVTKAKPYLAEIYDYDHDATCSETIFAIAGQGISESEIENEYGELNGKVVARFKAKAEVIYYQWHARKNCIESGYHTATMSNTELLKRACLWSHHLEKYFGKTKVDIDVDNAIGTALHIEDLEIFDKPKELGEFVHPIPLCRLRCYNNFIDSFCRNHCSHNRDPERLGVWCDRDDKMLKPLDKAPQSWCYVEEGER